MLDHGVDEFGYPLTAAEELAQMQRRKRQPKPLTAEQLEDLFPTGDELKRRRVALKEQCDRLGWEFVGEP